MSTDSHVLLAQMAGASDRPLPDRPAVIALVAGWYCSAIGRTL